LTDQREGQAGGLPLGRAALARIRFCARHPAATSRPSLTVAPHNRHQRAGIFAAYTWVGINVELPSEQAGAVLQAVIGPRLSRPLVGVVLRQTMAVAASAGLDEFVAAADRHPVFELTITETTKVPGSVPAALIGVGLLIGVLHASLGRRYRQPPANLPPNLTRHRTPRTRRRCCPDGSAGELSPFYVVRNGEGEKVQHRGEVVFLASPNRNAVYLRSEDGGSRSMRGAFRWRGV